MTPVNDYMANAVLGYKSPIELYMNEIKTKVEGDCVKAVQEYGFKVDKYELAKALKYDRDQYNAGYSDGYMEARRKFERPQGKWIDEGQYAEGHSEHYYRCSECGGHIIELRVDDFCKHCGADMRVKDELNKELNERPQIISCFNCKHDYKTEKEEPCKYCNEKFSEWEVGGEK